MTTPFEKRACLSIFVFQLIGVLLSLVSIIYFTIAVYIPSRNSYISKISAEYEVTCILLENANTNIQTFGDKGKLPTDDSGKLLRTGSSIRLEGCNPDFDVSKTCPKTHSYQCINGECASLNGLFNCTIGPVTPTGEMQGAICKNVTSALSCNLTTTDAPIHCNSKKACLRLDGLFEFNYGEAAKIRPPFECEKLCSYEVTTDKKDVIIVQKPDSEIYTGNCARAFDSETGVQIWPKSYYFPQTWKGRPPVLIMTCEHVKMDPMNDTAFELTECGNGDLVEPDHFGGSIEIKNVLDGEYDVFGRLVRVDMGKGSEKKMGHIWFQCFYSRNFVFVQFGRLRAVMGLMIAAVIPVVLGIISYCIICGFTKSGKATPKIVKFNNEVIN